MHDAHFHMSPELFAQLQIHKIRGIASSSMPEEYEELCRLQEGGDFEISYGVHPWDVDKIELEQAMPILEQCSIVGEIGLDNVWCKTSARRQEDYFEAQLAYASRSSKPLILHIKGRERDALDFLRRYPNRYLVHWYSSLDYLEDYMDLDCYFTVGPSVGEDDAVTQVAKRVSLDRLLLESDGIDAIAWAKHCSRSQVDYMATLEESVHMIASLRQMEVESIERILDDNFRRFLDKM